MTGHRPAKRSLTLQGHRTSVSLEPAFWQSLREIADQKGISINALAAEVDATRGDVGLATALRLAILAHLRARAGLPPLR
jgi:predicted DNA-binding ribbon-helix-helix protein